MVFPQSRRQALRLTDAAFVERRSWRLYDAGGVRRGLAVAHDEEHGRQGINVPSGTSNSEAGLGSKKTAMPPQLSIVAPVYNEAGNLERLVAETHDAMTSAGLDYELILVDDRSTDGSRDVLTELATGNERPRVLSLERHAGQSAALLAGLRAARAPLVVTIDADLQNDPADIPAIVRLLEDHDVVSGVRAKRKDTAPRRLASWISNRVRRLILGDPCTDIGCALKGYRAAALQDLPPFDGLHRFLPLLALRHGGNYAEIPVRHRARTAGASKYNIRGRFLRGVLDLFGVSWYRRRAVSVTVKALERSPCHPSHPISSGRQ